MDNYAKISKAYRKLSEYLMHGKPVLMSNFLSSSQLADKYQFGVAINDPSDPRKFNSAIGKILNSYDTYSHNAKFFEAEFDFKKNGTYITYRFSTSTRDIVNRRTLHWEQLQTP